ncbi:thioredoxin family protein [Olleya aquimaris]|uniref:Thioredoxin-related protein n=1 Tax=Olleya aquimaris TaxID=639310 RepID=A0A327REJ2_9FLAO|nr:thioredoxin fold domain-containing protein [Olleya aquimaris]RAJ15121.1 thioredoxin-related protein [Olleya aquimaris]
MKHILLVLTMLFTYSGIAQDQINWITLEEAVELQKTEPRKIIMDAYTTWCGPCKLLDARTFTNKDLIAYINKNYYAVKFNAQGNDTVTFKGKTYTNPKYNPAKAKTRNSSHELAIALGIRSYPTLLFFDEDANLITPVIGYKTPQQLELYLKMFTSNKHKDMKTQADFDKYYKEFKATFKDNA